MSNFIGSPEHSTKTQRCQNTSLYNSQQQNYKLEYSKLFSHVTETVLIDVMHDNAVDTHLRFDCIKYFCLRNIQILWVATVVVVTKAIDSCH